METQKLTNYGLGLLLILFSVWLSIACYQDVGVTVAKLVSHIVGGAIAVVVVLEALNYQERKFEYNAILWWVVFTALPVLVGFVCYYLIGFAFISVRAATAIGIGIVPMLWPIIGVGVAYLVRLFRSLFRRLKR